jgi:hypothetical protein
MYEANTFIQDCVALSISLKLLKEFRLNLIMGGSNFRTLFGSFFTLWDQQLTQRRTILPQMMLASLWAFIEPKDSVIPHKGD